MSYNNVTIESLLADSIPSSNFTWSEKFPNLSSLSPNMKYEGDKKLLLKKYSTYKDFDIGKFHNSYKYHSKKN